VVLIGIGALLLILWLGRDHGASPVSDRLEDPAASQSGAGPREAVDRRDQPVGTTGRSDSTVREAAAPPGGVSTPGGTVPSADPQPPRTTPGTGFTDLLIVADRPSWLALTVDGERVAWRMLQPREAVHARMRQRATLRTGDAGALRLSVDGSEPRPVGPSGAVRTVELEARSGAPGL
jgi:hypothetical protein